MINKKKQLGQVFTPTWIVDLILKRLDYAGSDILNKYVFEPGCGNGNFLEKIVQKYIDTGLKNKKSKNDIVKGLEKYIYGVEIDNRMHEQCLGRLNDLVSNVGIKDVKWNIYNCDILDLDINKLPGFHYVIGNPPYVRIHNLNKDRIGEIKERFTFCKNGIIDLFLVFFEIGLLSLDKEGKLGFITPNSFIHNSTYGDFRDYLTKNKLVKELINFKENIIFDDASTYNAITILDNQHQNTVFDYYEYADEGLLPISKIDLIDQDSKKWNLTNVDDKNFLDEIKNRREKISDHATVQYGFATLRDRIYLFDNKSAQDELFKQEIEVEILHPVVKGSRYDGGEIKNKILYPYYFENGTWKVIPEEILSEKYPNLYKYLLNHKKELETRSIDKGALWYEYGRSQGVQSMHNEKLVISPLIKDEIKIFKVDNKTMVYSGIYIFINKNSKYSLEQLMARLKSEEFKKYAKMLGKDMRGGYKSINTKIIKEFPV